MLREEKTDRTGETLQIRIPDRLAWAGRVVAPEGNLSVSPANLAKAATLRGTQVWDLEGAHQAAALEAIPGVIGHPVAADLEGKAPWVGLVLVEVIPAPVEVPAGLLCIIKKQKLNQRQFEASVKLFAVRAGSASFRFIINACE